MCGHNIQDPEEIGLLDFVIPEEHIDTLSGNLDLEIEFELINLLTLEGIVTLRVSNATYNEELPTNTLAANVQGTLSYLGLGCSL